MKQIRLGRIPTVLATLVVIAGLATSASAAPSGSCPNITQENFLAAPNVAAGFTNNGNLSTYWFASLTDEHPVNGVPGLVKYCVYPSPEAQPEITVVAEGANGDLWISGGDASSFMFGRPSGNKSNIPLDGTTTYPMGTATWDTVPTAQTILLHINDRDVCHSIYGSKTPDTCFVLPSAAPVCNVSAQDLTGVAYSSIPRDAVDCGPPSHAFEATSTKEFGDEVELAGSGTLQSLTVLFNSYACEDKPQWNNSQCYTANPLNTFSHEITANIYAVNDSTDPHTPGALLATATQTFTIPYRPSADTLTCGNTGKFFNPISGNCETSKKTLLTFTNWNTTPNLSGKVIWTVAFNTSDYGDTPLRPQSCNATVAGCPYDSLNVGTKTFPGAPYVGTDVNTHGAFINSTWNGIYCDNGDGGTGFLRESSSPPTCTNLGPNFAPDAWLGYTPLATIRIIQ